MKRLIPPILMGVLLAATVATWHPSLLPHVGSPGVVAAWVRGILDPVRGAGLGFDVAFLLRWAPALALALVVGAAAWGAGSHLEGWLPLPAMRASSRAAVRFLAGMGLLSPALGALGLAGAPGRWIAALGACILVATAIARERRGTSWSTPFGRSRQALPVLLPVGMVLLAALSPPVQSDGLRYHLVAAQEWHHGGFATYLRFNSFTNLPNLLALATSFAWPHAEVFQLLHAAGFVALVALAGELGALCVRSVDPGAEDRAAAAARLLAASIPVVSIVASWPFADVAAAGAVLACATLGLVSLERQARAMPTALWMGLCAGTAGAFKLTAAPMAFLASAIVLGVWVWREGRSPRQARAALLFCAAGAVPLLPFLLRNLANVGNPLYFPLPGLAGMGDWTAECARFYSAKAAEKGFGHGVAMLALSPILTALRWDAFEGQNPGAAWLPMLVLALRYGSRRGGAPGAKQPLLAMALATWILWFAGYQSLRFAMVPLVLVAALAGAGWAREFASSPSRLARSMPLWLAAPGIAWALWWNAFGSATPPIQSAFAPREHVLARAFNAYPTLMALESHLRASRPAEARARDLRVFYVGEHRGAYAEAFQPVHSDWFDTPRILVFIRGTKSNEGLLDEWRRRRIDYALVNLAELRLYADRYFRPRFSPAEWQRFEAMLRELHRRRILGDDSIFVADLRGGATAPGEAAPRTR